MTRRPTCVARTALTLFCLLSSGVSAPAGTASQTISWNSLPTDLVLVLGQAYTLEASASSGLPVTFRVERGPAVIGDGTVTATNVGTISLVAEQAGNETHSPAIQRRVLNPLRVIPELVSQWPGTTQGPTTGISVIGTRAYLASGRAGFQIVDVSNPSNPARLGGRDYFARDVQVVGNLAYVVDGAALLVIEVSNPSNPVVLGLRFTAIGCACGLQVVDHLVYVANGSGGVEVIDVAEPSHPSRVVEFQTGGEAHNVQVAGNFAYVAAGIAGFQIRNVSDPSSPVYLGGYGTDVDAHGVHVVGNLAYVANGYRDTSLLILDVSNPLNPIRVGGVPAGGFALAQGVQVEGNLAFLSTTGTGLRILDVSDPSNPVYVGGRGGDAYDVQVDGNLAYVAFGELGLRIFRIDAGVEQTIAFDAPPAVSASTSLTLTASASSGLPVTFSVVSGPATLAGNRLTVTNQGLVLVRAHQPGNDQFLRAAAERFIDAIGPVRLATAAILANGRLHFTVDGPFGGELILEASEDLISWLRLEGAIVNGADVEVPPSHALSHRFYRVRLR